MIQLTPQELKEFMATGGSDPVPFKIGTAYLFRTIGYHWLGRVSSVCGKFLTLEEAGWVADTGRYSEACASGIHAVQSAEFEPTGRPAILNTDHVTDAVEYPFQIGGLK